MARCGSAAPAFPVKAPVMLTAPGWAFEAPLNIFVKGNIGLGSLAAGQLHDEDWVIFGGTVPYSNTLSDPVKGKIDYATLDLG